jgi:hypothetical protein
VEIRHLVLTVALAMSSAAGAKCPSAQQEVQLKNACAGSLKKAKSASCTALRTSIGKICGQSPIPLAKITGACGSVAACTGPVGRPNDLVSTPGTNTIKTTGPSNAPNIAPPHP